MRFERLALVLQRLDESVRCASVRAHHAALEEAAGQEPLPLGPVTLGPAAIFPRELLEVARVTVETPIALKSGPSGQLDVGLAAAAGVRCRLGRGRGRLVLEWRRTPAPESTALVRTGAEREVANGGSV